MRIPLSHVCLSLLQLALCHSVRRAVAHCLACFPGSISVEEEEQQQASTKATLQQRLKDSIEQLQDERAFHSAAEQRITELREPRVEHKRVMTTFLQQQKWLQQVPEQLRQMTAQLRCDEGTVADIEQRIGTLQVEQRAHLDQHMPLSLYEKILAHGKSDMLAATCRWLRKLVADAEVHVQLKLLWEEGQHREAMHHIILELLQLNPNVRSFVPNVRS